MRPESRATVPALLGLETKMLSTNLGAMSPAQQQTAETIRQILIELVCDGREEPALCLRACITDGICASFIEQAELVQRLCPALARPMIGDERADELQRKLLESLEQSWKWLYRTQFGLSAHFLSSVVTSLKDSDAALMQLVRDHLVSQSAFVFSLLSTNKRMVRVLTGLLPSGNLLFLSCNLAPGQLGYGLD